MPIGQVIPDALFPISSFFFRTGHTSFRQNKAISSVFQGMQQQSNGVACVIMAPNIVAGYQSRIPIPEVIKINLMRQSIRPFHMDASLHVHTFSARNNRDPK
jgi:hypothetical protein